MFYLIREKEAILVEQSVEVLVYPIEGEKKAIVSTYISFGQSYKQFTLYSNTEEKCRNYLQELFQILSSLSEVNKVIFEKDILGKI